MHNLMPIQVWSLPFEFDAVNFCQFACSPDPLATCERGFREFGRAGGRELQQLYSESSLDGACDEMHACGSR